MPVTRHNHFVPEFYLKRWAEDGRRVWCYHLLVPHRKVPEWSLRPTRGLAYQRDLYTIIVDGQDSDEFERWIEAEFETPAQSAIERAIAGATLTRADWERLALFLAAQDVRTPTNYLESQRRWRAELPGLMQRTLEQSVRELTEAKRAGRQISAPQSTGQDIFQDMLQVEINPNARPETNEGKVAIYVTVGRRLWLQSQRHLLTTTAKVLLSQSWSIAEASAGAEWYTCDHPVVRLNYYRDGRYDLRGGWGRKGGNVLMPLSPTHLLLTQIGESLPKRLTLTEAQTSEIQRIIAQRAYRAIFARKPIKEVSQLRPRQIDREAYRQEWVEWQNWHTEQSEAETRPK